MIDYLEKKIKENKHCNYNERDLNYSVKNNLINKKDIDLIFKYNYDYNFKIISQKSSLTFIEYESSKSFLKSSKEINYELLIYRVGRKLNLINTNVINVNFKSKDCLLFAHECNYSPNEFEKITSEDNLFKKIKSLSNKEFFKSLFLAIITGCTKTEYFEVGNKKHPIYYFESNRLFKFYDFETNLDMLLECLFKYFYDDINDMIFMNLNKDSYEKILALYKWYLTPKEYEKAKNDLNIIVKKLNILNRERKSIEFNNYDINSIEELLKYIDKEIEYGTIVRVKNKKEKIPFGTFESIETDNKNINFDNRDVINFINEYYSTNKKKINPDNLNITQIIKNITTLSTIINEVYFPNNPLDNLKYRISNSLEQMELIATYLNTKKISYKKYSLSEKHIANGKIKLIDTQFIIIANINNNWVYLESLLKSFKGMHSFKTIEDLQKTIFSKLIYFREKNINKDLDINKYVFNDITNINFHKKYTEIINDIEQLKPIYNKEILKIYNLENSIRKEIINGNTTAYLSDFSELNINKREIGISLEKSAIKILCDNVLNLIYKNNNEKSNYYFVSYNGIEYINAKSKKKRKNVDKIIIIILFLIALGSILLSFPH